MNMSKNFKVAMITTVVVTLVASFGFGCAKGAKAAHESDGVDTVVVEDTTVVETFDTVYAE